MIAAEAVPIRNMFNKNLINLETWPPHPVRFAINVCITRRRFLHCFFLDLPDASADVAKYIGPKLCESSNTYVPILSLQLHRYLASDLSDSVCVKLVRANEDSPHHSPTWPLPNVSVE
jgi:hypothetical protein